MADRDRMIALLNKAQDRGVAIIQSQMDDRITNINYIENSYIADFLIQNGVIVPPVKEGTEVYAVTYNSYTLTHTIRRGYVACIDIRSTGEYTIIRHQGLDDEPYFDQIVGRFDDYGKTIFLTREEAEKALEEQRKEND